MNHFFLRGNLIKEPELKYTPSGLAVCNLTLAGATEERRWYHRIVTYAKTAELFADTPINTVLAITGNIQQRESNNGAKYTNTVGNEVRAVHTLPDDTFTTDENGNNILKANAMTASSWAMVSGNLVKDVRVADTSRGQVCNAFIAINEYIKGEARTTFLQITAFNDCGGFDSLQQAEKGQYVIVEGPLVINRWTDRDDRLRYDPNVLAEVVHLSTREGAGLTRVDGTRSKPGTSPRAPIVDDDEFPPEADLPF